MEKFAHENGLEQSVLSRFLSGNRDLMLSTVLRIAEALEIPLGDLLPSNVLRSPAEKFVATTPAKPRQRQAIKVVLSEVSSLTVLRTAQDPDPIVMKTKG